MKSSHHVSGSPRSQPSPTSGKPRFPFPALARSSSRKLDRPTSCEILDAPSPTPLSSASPRRSFSRSFRRNKAKVSDTSCPSPPTSAHPPGNLTVSETQMHEVQQVFAHFDTNGDGKISAEELRSVLASLGDNVTSEDAALMVGEVDLDGDGYIDLGEFMGLNARCRHAAMAEEEMAATFAVFDVEKKGRITAEGLQAVLRRLGGSVGGRTSVEDCKRMIRGIDRKGSGHVDFEDFKRMMSPLHFESERPIFAK